MLATTRFASFGRRWQQRTGDGRICKRVFSVSRCYSGQVGIVDVDDMMRRGTRATQLLLEQQHSQALVGLSSCSTARCGPITMSSPPLPSDLASVQS